MFEDYIQSHGLTIIDFSRQSGIAVSTLRNLNKIPFEEWKIKYIISLTSVLNKSFEEVLHDLDSSVINDQTENCLLNGKYELENRRYIGNKSKLIKWLKNLMLDNVEGRSFLDLFSGTAVVCKNVLDMFDTIIINDFLYSNEIIYNAFFSNKPYDIEKIKSKENYYQNKIKIKDNYFSDNYGNKFFSLKDSRLIGEIREDINRDVSLLDREKNILLASLIYSCDKVANTVGHYDAFRKKVEIQDKFKFELINPIDTKGKNIQIYREDANSLVKNISADVVFIDPPYNSRQYSRFYHLLENLVKWEKPELSGVAMKPPVENMSEYSKSNAPLMFDDLIKNIKAKYIVVTYNNTYLSKSSSSKNKITHEEIIRSLSKVGQTKQYEKPYRFFNAGKSDFSDHKEYVFITKVGEFDEK